MKRVIGMDIHRTFAEVVFWEDGRLRPHGRVDMTRAGLEGFARGLTKDDEVVVEATGNAMAVVRVLSPYVARGIVANPLQVKAIAHARIKTDKGTVRNSVYGRAVERHQPAMALVKRSPKRTANWALAIAHAPGGILHSFSARFKTRNRSFRAASSVGKWPLALTARRSFELSASMAFVV